jgi:hypothetical protein
MSYDRGHECVYSTPDEILDSTQKPRSEYTVSCFFLALLWPLFFYLFFAHSPVPRTIVIYMQVRI